MSPRVALVTGCGKPDGMGQAIARRLAADGMAVLVSDRRPDGVPNARQEVTGTGFTGDGLAELVHGIAGSGGRADAVLGDISDPDDVHAMADAAVERHGRLDVLVNNAAAPQGADRVDIEDVPLEAFDSAVAITLRGTYLMCRAAVPVMRRARYGRIVNISSMAGLTGAPFSVVYSATKAGILGMTRSLAMDVAAWGITVNAVCPGMVATSRAILDPDPDLDESAVIAERGRRIAVGRAGLPDDVAEAVGYLASEGAGYVTAQALGLDGGGFGVFPARRPAESNGAAGDAAEVRGGR